MCVRGRPSLSKNVLRESAADPQWLLLHPIGRVSESLDGVIRKRHTRFPRGAEHYRLLPDEGRLTQSSGEIPTLLHSSKRWSTLFSLPVRCSIDTRPGLVIALSTCFEEEAPTRSLRNFSNCDVLLIFARIAFIADCDGAVDGQLFDLQVPAAIQITWGFIRV